MELGEQVNSAVEKKRASQAAKKNQAKASCPLFEWILPSRSAMTYSIDEG